MKLLSGSPVRLWLSAAVLFSGASISAADNLEEAKNAGLGHLDWLSERQQKIVKDLEATVIGKLMQADGGKPLPRKQVLGQADRRR